MIRQYKKTQKRKSIFRSTSSVSSTNGIKFKKINQYRLIKTLGSGAYGTVYLCTDTDSM